MNNLSVWFDITNTPQVHLLLAVKSMLKNEFSYIYTARNFSETTGLLKQKGIINPFVIGEYAGKNKANKAIRLISRLLKIYHLKLKYDLSISCGSEDAVWLSRIKRKKNIVFGDNDLAKQWTYGIFTDFAFFPNSIEKKVLIRQGLSEEKLYLYKGYKEDLYLANYVPDDSFISKLPFRDYVILRPENIFANYVPSNTKSIVPELFDELIKRGYKVVFLPRYKSDVNLVYNTPNAFIPEEKLNGLDLCFHSSAVLTGAGTFAREAACMGVPSFSFFAGKRLLAVDLKLKNEKKLIHSRSVNEIINQLKNCKKSNENFNKKSMEVFEEVKYVLNSQIAKFKY